MSTSTARAALAADLRRLARLAESGLLDGEHFTFDVHVDSAARVQAVIDALGGEVRRYRSHTDTVQASATGSYVGSVRVCPIVNTDAPWGEGADSDETWAALVDRDAADAAETDVEPAATGVDLFECAEPGCDYAIGAAGPVDPENPYEFEEEVREHQRSHDAGLPFQLAEVRAVPDPNGLAQIPGPSIHAEALAAAARLAADETGKPAVTLAWLTRARFVAAGRLEDAALWLQALAVLGAPGAVVAAGLAAEPGAVPSNLLVSAVRNYRRSTGGAE